MGGGLESRSVGGVYGLEGAVRVALNFMFISVRDRYKLPFMLIKNII